MGINNYVVSSTKASLVIGGLEFKVNSLLDIGKSDHHTADAIAPALGGRVSGVVLVPGKVDYQSRATALVLGWEPGLTHTNDSDWSSLPRLGSAHMDDANQLVLHSDDFATAPMTRKDAENAGILDSHGHLNSWKRPRIVSAEVIDGWRHEHPNRSSMGPVVHLHHDLMITFDNGETEKMVLMAELAPEAIASASDALKGQPAEFVNEWAKKGRLHDQQAEGRAVKPVLDGGLYFNSGTDTAWFAPTVDRGQRKLFVGGNQGGAGYGQDPHWAFFDLGDRLAKNDNSVIRSEPRGYLALQIGKDAEMAVVIVSDDHGGLGVMWGGPLPASYLVVANSKKISSFDSISAGAALVTWENEALGVPPDQVGRFLADFAVYLSLCSERVVARETDPQTQIPTFREFAEENGILYDPGLPMKPF